MHPALAVTELVELVCEKLHEPKIDELAGNEGTLASLAVTCRAFREPALDTLWRIQLGIDNIIKCLPSHLWEIREDGDPMTVASPFSFHLIGPVQPADWTVPLSYSRRIKVLLMKEVLTDLRFPDGALFEAIASTLPSQLLCPNLQVLTAWADGEAYFPYLNLFLGPRIKDVSIAISRFDIPIPSNLNLQSLKKLHVLSPLPTAAEITTLCRSACDLIRQLHQIEELWVPNVDREALEQLSRLPSLKVLTLDHSRVGFHGPATMATASGAHLVSPLFPALQRVFLHDALPNFIVEFLKLHSSDCPISYISVTITEGGDLSAVSAAISSRLCSVDDLTLYLTLYEGPPSIHDGNINDLVPLLSLGNLVRVNLTLPVVRRIDDALLMDIATSWPKLKALTLQESDHRLSQQLQPPRMTLNGIVALATYCRDLERLTLQINGAAAILAPADDHFPEPQLALRTFEVGSSPIGSDADSVAEFLGRLFPRLRSIDRGFHQGTSEVARTTERRWKRVQKLLRKEKHV
ncbi:hypothetical protein FB45DRAFT_823087 [Roridomyces roridus]|uniref:F-box domain-containing protein n=1 Tax=Roridomyces roridus TaxID=1738132 RepID=A0AAD7CIH3_9AGAR|nr:hypothetical protein FB45DRAFT_823087 [Roridomyces roridus]